MRDADTQCGKGSALRMTWIGPTLFEPLSADDCQRGVDEHTRLYTVRARGLDVAVIVPGPLPERTDMVVQYRRWDPRCCKRSALPVTSSNVARTNDTRTCSYLVPCTVVGCTIRWVYVCARVCL